MAERKNKKGGQMKLLLQITLSVLIIGLGILAISVKAKPAHCAWCPSFTCYDSAMCGQGCACMIPGGQTGGQCVSLQ